MSELRIRYRKHVDGGVTVFVAGGNYQARAQRQGADCTEGRHWHNPVDDECCPCFGCCAPKKSRG